MMTAKSNREEFRRADHGTERLSIFAPRVVGRGAESARTLLRDLVGLFLVIASAGAAHGQALYSTRPSNP